MSFGVFQLRRGTAAQWTSANPVLAAGEIGLETDTNQFKVGNGSSTWTARPYGGIQGPQGRSVTSIARTSGTGAAGTTDTYTITYSDSTTSTFQVVNGANGANGSTPTVGVGTVTTGAAGSSVLVTEGGTALARTFNFTIPRGDTGATGDKGWSPILAVITDGTRRVLQIVDWAGGAGTKPSTTNQFIGTTGIVSTAAAAADIRGPAGTDGTTPSNQITTNSTQTGLTGDKTSNGFWTFGKVDVQGGAVGATGVGLLDNGNRAYSDSNPPQTLLQTETAIGSPPATPASGYGVQYLGDDGVFRAKNDGGQTFAMPREYATAGQVNILDFGADRTGVNSSATALTNAIAYCQSAWGGGVVYFPAGTYHLGNTTYTTTNASGITLRGASRTGTTISSTSTTGDIINIPAGQGYISIEDMTFAGPATSGDVQNTSATAGYAINALGHYVIVRRCQIRTVYNGIHLGGILDSIFDVEIRYWKGVGVHVDHNSDHQISWLIMDNNTSFLPTGGAGVRVSQAASLLMTQCNIIHANFCLDVAPATGVTVPSIKALNCFFDTSVVGLNMTSAGFFYRSEFTNCWFSSMSEAGIKLAPTTADGVDGVTFNACDIYNNVAGTTTGINAGANVGRWKMIGSNIAGWTTGINLVAGTNHFPTISACSVGANAAFGVNGTGIAIGAGTYNGLIVAGNDFADNTVEYTLGALTIASVAATAKRFRIIDNSGINPLGVATTPPAATPVLATTYINNTGFRVLLTVKHGATANTAVTINGIANTMGFLASQVVSYVLEPGSTWAVAGGTAPTIWVWNRM